MIFSTSIPKATGHQMAIQADVGWGGKLNSYLMASCFRNICAKNHQNPLILFKVTIDNVGVPFLRHSVYACMSHVVNTAQVVSLRPVCCH